jgi:hypothetical protein
LKDVDKHLAEKVRAGYKKFDSRNVAAELEIPSSYLARRLRLMDRGGYNLSLKGLGVDEFLVLSAVHALSRESSETRTYRDVAVRASVGNQAMASAMGSLKAKGLWPRTINVVSPSKMKSLKSEDARAREKVAEMESASPPPPSAPHPASVVPARLGQNARHVYMLAFEVAPCGGPIDYADLYERSALTEEATDRHIEALSKARVWIWVRRGKWRDRTPSDGPGPKVYSVAM